jgi:hypothetical protein
VAKLPITIACGPYDRVRPLRDGRVVIDGCEPNFLTGGPEEIFFRAIKHREFDVTEMSMSSHMMALSRGDAYYLPIPVFLSRVFRHSAFYIRTDRGIKEPKDLIGREVGLPEYQITAALWARGILEDEYGIPPSAIKWRTGGLHQAGRAEKTKLMLPPEIDVKPIPSDKSLDDMLREGTLRWSRHARRGVTTRGCPTSAGCSPNTRRWNATISPAPGCSRSCTRWESVAPWWSNIPGCPTRCSTPSSRRRISRSRRCATSTR